MVLSVIHFPAMQITAKQSATVSYGPWPRKTRDSTPIKVPKNLGNTQALRPLPRPFPTAPALGTIDRQTPSCSVPRHQPCGSGPHTDWSRVDSIRMRRVRESRAGLGMLSSTAFRCLVDSYMVWSGQRNWIVRPSVRRRSSVSYFRHGRTTSTLWDHRRALLFAGRHR